MTQWAWWSFRFDREVWLGAGPFCESVVTVPAAERPGRTPRPGRATLTAWPLNPILA